MVSNPELSEHLLRAQHLCLMPAQKKLSLKASVTSVLLFLHLGEQEPQTGFLFKEDSRGSSLPCLNHEGMLHSPDSNIKELER